MVDKLEGQLLHGGTIGPRTWRFGVTTGGDSKAKEMNGKVPKGIPKSINDDVAVAQEEAKARRQDVEGCPGAHVQYRNRLRETGARLGQSRNRVDGIIITTSFLHVGFQ
jgi:hypothetical protein